MSQTNTHKAASWQEALISSIEVGVVVLNKDFVVEEWNQFMENHTSISTDAIKDKSLFEQVREINANWFMNKCQPVFELQIPVFIIWEQRQYLFKMHSARPISSPSEYMYQNVTIFPIINPANQQVEKACMLVYDVTDEATSKLRIEGLNDKLEVISRVDGLTGLYNRRYWQERFELEYKLIFRTNKALSVIILDIDHFKKVNDTYGHQAGDSVIKEVAKIITKSTRETDIAGRYGGEEFVAILPDTSSDNAKIVADRIRTTTEAACILHDGLEIKVTVSIGIAQFSVDYLTAMQWLEAADSALYKAKQSGRNLTMVASTKV
ncbi:MAG: GGDEF domain-containing protein [Pseudomonadota bacterium]